MAGVYYKTSNQTTDIMKTLLALTALVLSSCVTASSLPQGVEGSIPNGATAVVVHSASDCYANLYRHLASSGYAFEQENAEMGTLRTAPRDIGQETTLAVTAYVETLDNGCKATLRGVWGVSQTMAAGFGGMSGGAGDEAKWTYGRPRRAYSELVMIAGAVPHVVIEYIR